MANDKTVVVAADNDTRPHGLGAKTTAATQPPDAPLHAAHAKPAAVEPAECQPRRAPAQAPLAQLSERRGAPGRTPVWQARVRDGRPAVPLFFHSSMSPLRRIG